MNNKNNSTPHKNGKPETALSALGIIVGFLAPALLLIGPILLAVGLDASETGIAGGVCLGLGLVVLNWRIVK